MTVKSILSSIWLSAALICAAATVRYPSTPQGHRQIGPWYGGIVQYTELTEISKLSRSSALVAIHQTVLFIFSRRKDLNRC